LTVTVLFDDIVASGVYSTYEMQKKRDCRACRFFIRVRKDGDFSEIRRRGFCLLGRLEGDFSLYISSSEAETCEAFLLDDYNYETTVKERELLKEWADFRFKLEDRRTKEYKQLKKLMGTFAERLKLAENIRYGLAGIRAHREAVAMAYDYFVEANSDRFEWLWKRRAVDKKEYARILATISKVLESVLLLIREGEMDGHVLQK